MQFLIFGGDKYERDGGWHDFWGTATTLKEAIEYGGQRMHGLSDQQSWCWFHVVDSATNKIVFDSEKDNRAQSAEPRFINRAAFENHLQVMGVTAQQIKWLEVVPWERIKRRIADLPVNANLRGLVNDFLDATNNYRQWLKDALPESKDA